MTVFRRLLPLLVIFCISFPVVVVAADDCETRIDQLEQSNRQLHEQLRQARRELALEKSRETEAGWPQVLAGVGVIFGLCGVAMMLSAKKKSA